MSSLTMYRGEHKTFTVTATEDGTAINLTGAAIYFEVRTDYPASSVTTTAGAVITKSTVSGITITDALAGEFEIEFVKADTNTLEPKVYYYGLEYVPQGETEGRVLDQGQIVINPDVVRGV